MSQSVFLRGVNAIVKPGIDVRADREPYLIYEDQEQLDGTVKRIMVEDASIDELATVRQLLDLYTTLSPNGINPYYLFQNDDVYWARHLTVPKRQGIRIWEHVSSSANSGVVNTAQYVFDDGNGKIAVPKGGAFSVDYSEGYSDIRGNHHPL